MAEEAGKRARAKAAGAAALLALAAGLAGCGVGAESSPRPLDRKSVPYDLLKASLPPPRTSPSGAAETVVVIYLENGSGHLVPERRLVATPPSVAEALAQLSAGPTALESDAGLVSPASSVGPFGNGAVRDRVVEVDLPVSFTNLGGEDQIVAAAQIVYTVTAFSGIKGVRFLVGGQAARVPTQKGTLVTGPASRAEYSSLGG